MCTQKVMWYAAQIADAIHKYAPDYGFKGNIDEFNFGQLIQSRQAYIERIHRSYRMVFERNGVELIQGFARFIDKIPLRWLMMMAQPSKSVLTTSSSQRAGKQSDLILSVRSWVLTQTDFCTR